MTYDNFKQELISMLASRIPEDSRIEVKRVLKNNDLSLDGLLIISPEINIFPTIYLNAYYDAFLEGKSLEDIAVQILKLYQKSQAKNNVDISFFEEFSNAKQHIILKLVNAKKNQELLKDVPFVPFEDLAIVFCYYIPQGTCETVGDDASATVLIHHCHMEKWKIGVSELYQQARKNTVDLLKAELTPLVDLLCKLMSQESLDYYDIAEIRESIPIFVLTNHQRFMGASTILYPGILEKCAKEFDGDFYIIPSSIHEVLLLPINNGYSQEELTQLVSSVNQNDVPADEILSDHVYYYCKQTGKLCY